MRNKLNSLRGLKLNKLSNANRNSISVVDVIVVVDCFLIHKKKPVLILRRQYESFLLYLLHHFMDEI